MTLLDQLDANCKSVTSRMASACALAGRDLSNVRLIAVTKYAELEWVRGLYELGLRDFGESRPQQLVERSKLLPADVRWHLIGHLQRNKAALVLPHAMLIHSLDSLRLARQLDADASKQERRVNVLLEVNVAGEESKDGFEPQALRSIWQDLLSCQHLQIIGLMTMAPQADDPQSVRPVFRSLRELRDELQALVGTHPLPELSMGMSSDFENAILEGSTCIRVGSALFEGLRAPLEK